MSSPRSSFLVLAELADSPLRTSSLVLEDRVSFCRRSWEYAVGSWLLFRISCLTLDETLLWSNSWFPALFEALQSCGGVFFALRRYHDTQIHRSRFRHCRTFFRRTLLSSLGHDTLLSVLKLNGCRKTLTNSWCSTIEEDDPHSSRVKLPLVNMSASWILVSTYLIWILGFKLILSNKQSSATLSVLDTCLIVGLLPLMIILITASLSPKMYNWDSHWEECVCGGTWSHMRQLFNISVSLLFGFGCVSRVVSCLASVSRCPMSWCFGAVCRTQTLRSPHPINREQVVLVFELCEVLSELHVCSWTGLTVLYDSDSRFQELRRSDPINQVRGYHPTSILHPKKWFLILLNCGETEVCFLHIQLIGTDVWLPKTHKVPPEVDFESIKISRKIGVLQQSQSALFGSVSHMTILFVLTCMMNVRDQAR